MNLDALKAHRFEPQRISYDDRDTILYALSVGVGSNPVSERELQFAYEQDLRAIPTIGCVLAHPGAWIADPKFGVDFYKLLHGEQYLEVHNTIPGKATIDANYRVPAVVDKGEGRGALVYFEKTLTDAQTREPLCTVGSTLFLRGDGGCGSFGNPPASPVVPDMSFETIDELQTGEDWALLYRLNGDRNPIHVDPEAGRKAGFERPILHGLCTYGVVAYLLLRSVCDYDEKRLQTLSVRFSAPVMPGETIRLEGAKFDDGVSFQARVVERDQIVLKQGVARLASE